MKGEGSLGSEPRFALRRGGVGALWMLLMFLVISPGVEAARPAEDPLGKVEFLKGSVSVLKADGQELRAEPGMTLHAGDQISTGKAAELQFLLSQGGHFRLGPESQVAIDELSSSEGEESPPVMRLAMGYLRAKLARLLGRTAAFELHTPTAVLGVRGTEFDTVVSLDAASLVSVDEGKVDVEAEGKAVLVEQGNMTEVEFEGEPAQPSATTPQAARDWEAWREKRVERAVERLPRIAPRLRHRFEQAAVRAGDFTGTVQEKAARIREGMQEVRAARQKRDRSKARESVERLREQVEEFKGIAARFRQALNRFRVMGRWSMRLEMFLRENKDRFPERRLAFLQAQFAAIAQKREEVKDAHGKSISTIRELFRDLRAFREEGPQRGAR